MAWIETEWPEPGGLAGAWTGRLAVGCCLADEAIAWLETERGVARGLSVRDWKKSRNLDAFGLLGQAAGALGQADVARILGHLSQIARTQTLDGIVAIWQGLALN